MHEAWHKNQTKLTLKVNFRLDTHSTPRVIEIKRNFMEGGGN